MHSWQLFLNLFIFLGYVSHLFFQVISNLWIVFQCIYWKKFIYMWTCTVQICVVQGSTTYKEVAMLSRTIVTVVIFWGTSTLLFHSGCANLYSQQLCAKVPFSQHPCQNVLSLGFLIIALPTGMRWSLTVVWIIISLVVSDAELLFI